MATEEKLKFYIEEQQRTIEKAKQAIKEYQQDLNRLKQPDVLCVGDRVRLKRSYDTEEDRKVSTGWAAYLHFMNPNNPATVKTVECYHGKIGYCLKFDDQTCYYTHPSFEKPTYEADGVFYFPASAIVPIDKSMLSVRLTFNNDTWHELQLTAVKKEYIELLDELKETGAIKDYEIKELK